MTRKPKRKLEDFDDDLREAIEADPSSWLAAIPKAFDRVKIEAQWWALRDAASASVRVSEMEVSSTELADMLGFSAQYTSEAARHGILVKTERARFKLAESVRNYVSRLKGARASGEGGGVANFDADKARKMKADADLAEIVAAKAAGKLVVAKSVGSAWATAIGVAMSKLGGVGQKIGALVILERTAKGAADKIDDAIRGACEELHQVDIAAIAAAQEEEESLRTGGAAQ